MRATWLNDGFQHVIMIINLKAVHGFYLLYCIWSHRSIHGRPKGPCPLKFLTYFVALHFKRWCPKPNTVVAKSQNFDPSIF